MRASRSLLFPRPQNQEPNGYLGEWFGYPCSEYSCNQRQAGIPLRLDGTNILSAFLPNGGGCDLVSLSLHAYFEGGVRAPFSPFGSHFTGIFRFCPFQSHERQTFALRPFDRRTSTPTHAWSWASALCLSAICPLSPHQGALEVEDAWRGCGGRSTVGFGLAEGAVTQGGAVLGPQSIPPVGLYPVSWLPRTRLGATTAQSIPNWVSCQYSTNPVGPAS
jgi:hypothetical protein